jgi:hypothetical protein
MMRAFYVPRGPLTQLTMAEEVAQMRRILVLLCVLACLVGASVACSKGANPVAPTSVGGNGGTAVLTGDILIKYERPDEVYQNMIIKPPDMNPGCQPNGTVRLFSAPGGWPEGVEIKHDMLRLSDQVFEYLVKSVPARGNLAISAFDNCITTGGSYSTGTGFTVNGVRLRDETHWAHFDHRPGQSPSVLPR